MIRAVFFDIDGTLVSLKTKRCPDSTKAAIRALREKGIRVYVASGRSRFELEEQEMLRGMTFDGYLTNNGQIVYDGSWNLLRTVAMVPDEVRALVDYCDERSLPLWLVSEQRSRFNYHFNDRVPVVMAEIHTEILGQQRQVQLADGRVVLEHKADAVVRAPEGDLRQPAQGVLPAGHAPAALGGQLAADGGTGQCVCPALRAPRGLGSVEALQIGLHKIPVLFHHSSSTSNS